MALVSTELSAASQKNASGNTDKFKVPALSMLALFLRVTASSGTTPTLGLWLQWSPDGTNWYDVPYDLQLTSNPAAADLTANASKRNVNGAALATGAGSHVGVFKHVPSGYIRGIWVMAGTTPTFDFQIYAEGK